jgi:hypothetical protein
MGITGLENHRLGSFKARLREEAVACSKEQAEAIDQAFGVSKGELLLESALWLNEEAQKTHNSASGLIAMGDRAGALRQAPAHASTFKHVTISAHMPATHNAPHMDACRGAGGQRFGSCEEDSGFGDCSGDNTSDGRVSPETSEELPTRRLPVRLPTRGPSVERPAGRKQSKRKAKPKISPADTGGRGVQT